MPNDTIIAEYIPLFDQGHACNFLHWKDGVAFLCACGRTTNEQPNYVYTPEVEADAEILVAGPAPVADRDPALGAPCGESNPDRYRRRRGMGFLRAALHVAVILACSAGAYLYGGSRGFKRGVADEYLRGEAIFNSLAAAHQKEKMGIIDSAIAAMARRDVLLEKFAAEIRRLNSLLAWMDDQRKA